MTHIRLLCPFQYLLQRHAQFIGCTVWPATLVLWGLKISLSMPEFLIIFFTLWASESLDAKWVGLFKVVKNSVKSWVTISEICAKHA